MYLILVPTTLYPYVTLHRINKSLFLAPKGKWSNLDYVLNKDPLVEVFIDDFRLWSELDRLNKTVYFNRVQHGTG